MNFTKIHLTPKWRRAILRGLLIIVAAYALTFFLEYRHFINSFGEAWYFVNTRSLVFHYSAFIMALALLLLSAIFRKPWTSIGVMGIFLIILTYIHISKFNLRSNPLLPEDFMMADQAGTLTNFVDFSGLIKMLIAIILVVILTILLNRLTGKFFLREKSDEPKRWWKRYDLTSRIALAIIAILGLLVTTDFARHHDGKRYMDVDWLDTYFVAWSQSQNYAINGFILGFLYNLNKFELQPPDGYSETKIAEIAEKHLAKKSADDTNRQALTNADYNIVVILNESFYDPSVIREYYSYDGEATPELRRIISKYPSGQMYSTDYGGGTANIEFEVNTGLSNYWADSVPYTDILPRVDVLQSVASLAKASGYQTIAVHPYNGGMYKRNFALPKQGFDAFIDKSTMDFTEYEYNRNGEIGEITDRSAYAQVLKILDENDERQMIGLITMQNHSPYPADLFDETTFEVTADIDNKDSLKNIETFMNVLHRSDSYLGEFVKKLDAMDEKTVVLFYGDHAPGIYQEVVGHDEQSVRDLSHLTPYFIYANFNMPLQGTGERINLPTTTPNCLVNTLYNVLNVQKPALNYLLDEICAQTPILSGFHLGEQGPFQSTELSEYEMVTYDILGGKQYWYKYTD